MALYPAVAVVFFFCKLYYYSSIWITIVMLSRIFFQRLTTASNLRLGITLLTLGISTYNPSKNPLPEKMVLVKN